MSKKNIDYKYFRKSIVAPTAPTGAEDVLNSVAFSDCRQVLLEAQQLWDGLDGARRTRRRGGKMTYGDQWSDLIQISYNKWITEQDHLISQGLVPLKNNLIRQLTKSLVGQFIQQQTEPIVVIPETDDIDPSITDERKIGELYSLALQDAYKNNELDQLDKEELLEFAISAISVQANKYDINPMTGKVGGLVRNINPSRIFWNSGLENSNGSDLTMIGEIMDVPLNEVVRQFAKTKEQAEEIRRLYLNVRPIGLDGGAYENMTTRKMDNLNFLYPYQNNLCRVILVWKIESKEQLHCHDTLDASLYWVDDTEKERRAIKAENEARIADAVAHGVAPEDVLLIEPEWTVRKFWYYRYFTPTGIVLAEGESPYENESHPYSLRFHGMFDGEVHSFVGDVIDQQKMINRYITGDDYARSTSSRTTVMYDSSILENNTPEQLAHDAAKPGAMIPVKVKPGQDLNRMVAPFPNTYRDNGSFNMIQLMMSFIDNISGVHGAAQGKTPASGTPSSLYAQEIQQAAVNLLDILSSFNAFRTQRDTKLLKLIQQYYTPEMYIKIAGKAYAKEAHFAAGKGVDLDVEVKLIPSTNSQQYKAFQDSMLMQLLQAGLIDVKMMLRNSSYSFKDQLIQEIESKEAEMQEMQAQQAAQGLPPEMMQQMGGGQGAPQGLPPPGMQ
ncbi:hypothetical protein AGMMS49965_13180 [Bacteroidia bacterium]|nr:hypothetical protein AGMMS49965_13180 [Bacteroidia bacterium]